MTLRAPQRAVDATMELTRLALSDFRSYVHAELAPDPGLTVIAGPNGTGKTNLLEAIHATIVGRSHRAGVDADLVRHGASFARVRLELAGGTEAGGSMIELVLPGAEPTPGIRKRLMVNGVPRRTTALPDVARVVLFRPEEMLLLVGSPSDRRRFLDGIVAQRDRRAARDLTEVARVVTQRNALLRAIRAEEASIDTLGFWDEQLAQLGARVMRARLEALGELGTRIGPLHDAVATDGERGASVELVYLDALKGAWSQRSEVGRRPPGDEELAAAYRRRITDVRQKEAWNGVSLVGPQRDDLRAELGGRDVASHASRGQQRTIILAMKLAETDLLGADGPRPIVLLDDVFSELDPDRAARLSDLLSDRGQVIVTTADPGTLEGARRRHAAFWRIDHGRLVRES
ncbi:MAG: DNA replication/repair protein RecF [Chloroflexota bacterium]|nr:DNA replication/repair protein RecF [Chloroflexota bacterium]